MGIYKIVSVDDNGLTLPPHELFIAWVQMAHDLSETLPEGPCKGLCAAVYEAVTNDHEVEMKAGAS